MFDRLSRIYAHRRMQPELAGLLERRIEGITDPDERLAMEVRRGRILLEVGDTEGARAAFEVALAERPDDAERAVGVRRPVRRAAATGTRPSRRWSASRACLPTPEEQRDVYARLGELYSHHLLNLSRAEVALKEVLRRAPDDLPTIGEARRRLQAPERSGARHRAPAGAHRQGAGARRTSAGASSSSRRSTSRRRTTTAAPSRRSRPRAASSRRTSGVLRALAEFYIRHHQTPAVNILLDRAGADARRALAAGRFSPGLFGVLATVFELRGKKDAARVAQAMLAAFEGRAAELRGRERARVRPAPRRRPGAGGPHARDARAAARRPARRSTSPRPSICAR